MNQNILLFLAFIISGMVTFLITPLVIRFAFKIGATDQPSERKAHIKIMPRIGGLAIYAGFLAGILVLRPNIDHLSEIIMGGFIIILVGFIDDMYNIRPIVKLGGQVAAAYMIVDSGLLINTLTVPFIGSVDFGNLAFFITVLWIVAVSNAINLIDGLDGLAAGVSTIALISLLVIAIIDYQLAVIHLALVLIGPGLGFLYHNFYPAKIFMGDTGALFYGYMIAVVSMLGLFKNVAVFSFIVPIIIIAVPVFDTLFAIIRRLVSRQKIGQADKKHIHHRLIDMGYSHRKTVLIIYGFSLFFGLMAVIFTSATMQLSFVIFFLVLLGIQLIAELTSIVPEHQVFILRSLRKLKKKLRTYKN